MFVKYSQNIEANFIESRKGKMTFNSVLGSRDYFMSVAFLTAMRSEDPSTKVGACIVNEIEKVVGLGFNRTPGIGVSIEWDNVAGYDPSEEEWINSKYPYVLHAEMDAILNKTYCSLNGCTMYTLVFPWNECAKLIVESGIKKVVYYRDKYMADVHIEASKKLFAQAGVVHKKFTPENEENVPIFEEMAKKTINIA